MEPNSNSRGWADMMIVVALAGILFTGVISTIVPRFVPEWYMPPTKYVMMFFNLLSASLYFLIAFAVKDTVFKIIALILAFFGFMLTLFNQVYWFMESI